MFILVVSLFSLHSLLAGYRSIQINNILLIKWGFLMYIVVIVLRLFTLYLICFTHSLSGEFVTTNILTKLTTTTTKPCIHHSLLGYLASGWFRNLRNQTSCCDLD